MEKKKLQGQMLVASVLLWRLHNAKVQGFVIREG